MTLHSTAVGIGLRTPHARELLEQRADIDFLEVHSENYFHAGGAAMQQLARAGELYALSLHGVGLSLGSVDALADAHLARLHGLVRRSAPALVSEHLSWSTVDGRCFHDLLPLPRTPAVVTHFSQRIDQVQQTLGRRILIENLSAYVEFSHNTLSEGEMLAALVSRTGCGLLLDVNNLYVNACNLGLDPQRELALIPAGSVGEYHLAGHVSDGPLLIDTHNQLVCDAVWALYDEALHRLGPAPTLIEWDSELPPLAVLLAQANHARQLMQALELELGHA